MSGLEVLGLAGLLVTALVFYGWAWLTYAGETKASPSELAACDYPVAASGSLFIPCLDEFVKPGSKLYIPAGDGLYHTRHRWKRSRYIDGLERWLSRHATIHIIVSKPSEGLTEQWQALKDRFPDSLHVHLLDREKAFECGETGLVDLIGKLDTFHAAILLAPEGSETAPGAMWIEANHPLGSRYAYHVEFVPPNKAALDDRLHKYQALYDRLLTGDYATELDSSKDSSKARRESIAA